MISILLPTRARPSNVHRLVKSVLETADNPEHIEFVVRIDDDDPKRAELLENPPQKSLIFTGPRIVLSEMWNECAHKSKGDIMMYCADDIVFRTPAWDKRVKEIFEQLNDKIAFVFGRDGSIHDGKYGTHGFVHRKWLETLGYICPPHFSGDYSDTWINDISKLVDRHIFIDILTEHLHPDFGKAELDEVYTEKYDRMNRDKVADLYFSVEMSKRRLADAEKLRKVMR